jgi:hypothetical protein
MSSDDPNQILLKFREDSYVRLRDGRFVIEADESSAAPADVDLSAVEAILGAFGISTNAVERLHTRPESELDTERKLASAGAAGSSLI